MENFLDLQELISLSSLQSFANDKVILFYNASNIRDLEAKGDTTKLNTVYEFYKNLMRYFPKTKYHSQTTQMYETLENIKNNLTTKS